MTSLSLSLQVYNASEGVYIFKDKYYGRELSPDGFHRALRDFLWNGMQLRTDIIPTLVDMLTRLREVIRSQDSFRFFSSSLLIMYDGGPPSHCTGGMLGRVSGGGECMCDSGEGVTNGEEGSGCNKNPDDSTHHPCSYTSHLHTCSLEEARKVVDVRMIDFAHTTHGKCERDPIKYSGPDDGYILGLNTLISAFREITNSCK